jgi:hypothetical protein
MWKTLGSYRGDWNKKYFRSVSLAYWLLADPTTTDEKRAKQRAGTSPGAAAKESLRHRGAEGDAEKNWGVV